VILEISKILSAYCVRFLDSYSWKDTHTLARFSRVVNGEESATVGDRRRVTTPVVCVGSLFYDLFSLSRNSLHF
jgi:hypothetical protein